ncbi:MAG: iron-sulfur cluster assembly scaffold protein [Acidobacteria bacterium]|nr:iron-sulfur cluster assembly scaffold protein [Acidobacteriota bacterium]
MPSACCSASPRVPSIIDYIERGLRRRRRPPLPIAGDVQHDAGGRHARFTLAVDGDTISAVAFEATTCATLVACCEQLAETVTGRSLDHARSAVPLAQLPQVPPDRHYLSTFAARALQSALDRASQGAR